MDPRIQLMEVKRTWTPPAEMTRCRPREVCLTAAGKALRVLSIILIVGAFAAGAILFVKASNDHALRQTLKEQGKGVPAQIVRLWKTGGKDSQNWAEYMYQVEGRTYHGRLRVGRRSYGGLAIESLLPVRYLPSDPHRHYVPGREGDLIPFWLPFLIALAMMTASWLVTRFISSQRRLLAEGRPAPGVITHLRKTKDGKVVHYAFSLPSGAVASGKTNPQKKPPEPGSIVCVLYMPDRVRHNGIYPLQLVRSAHVGRPAPAASSPHGKDIRAPHPAAGRSGIRSFMN